MASNSTLPANHWTNYLSGLDTLSGKPIFIPESGEFLGVDNTLWALFFVELGTTTTRSPSGSQELNQALLDTLFCGDGYYRVVSAIRLCADGSLFSVKLSTDDLRMDIVYAFLDSMIYKEEYRVAGHYSRLDGPAVIMYYPNGSVKSEDYLEANNRHRLDGPALTKFWEDGSIKSEEYQVNATRHRPDGPATVIYWNNGAIRFEEYRVTGTLHNLDGPACNWWIESGDVDRSEYWVNGCKMVDAELAAFRKSIRLDAIGKHLSGGYVIKQSLGAVNI